MTETKTLWNNFRHEEKNKMELLWDELKKEMKNE